MNPGHDEDGVIQPGLAGDAQDRIETLHATSLHWEGVSGRAEEWLAHTRVALAEARAQRARLICDQADGGGDLSGQLRELSARIEDLQRTERVQAAHAEDARPRAEASAAALTAEAEERLRRQEEAGHRERSSPTALLRPVAGCLFEIELPASKAGSGAWTLVEGACDGEPGPVSVIAVIETCPAWGLHGRHSWRFRLRAERPGRATVHFERGDGQGIPTAECHVELDIAPERLPADD